jgi:acetoin utilization protein AcuB
MMRTVSDLMTVSPYTVSLRTTLRHVIELMKVEGCRQFPVVENGKLVGIITDRDVRLVMNSPMVEHGRWQDEELLDNVLVESCMTANPMSVAADVPAHHAAKMLSIYKFGALPVVESEELVGIITVTDFLEEFVASHSEVVVDGS